MFKVGDVVRYSRPNNQTGGLVKGNEYKVYVVKNNFIRVEGNKWDYFQHRFDKVNKFKGNG